MIGDLQPDPNVPPCPKHEIKPIIRRYDNYWNYVCVYCEADALNKKVLSDRDAALRRWEEKLAKMTGGKK